MQFIPDKTHLRDHLYETAESLKISEKERGARVRSRSDAISSGEVARILTELGDEYQRNPNPRLKRLKGYLERFCNCVNYNAYKADGYPTGSGEVESAHKSIPQKRLKLPGASWSPESVNPMLALRILRANNRWEDFRTQRTQKRLAA